MNGQQSSTPGATVGIDLGTTNTLVAVLRPNGEAEVLPNRDQEVLTPSAISLPPKGSNAPPGTYLVGRAALLNGRRDPQNTVSSIKRFMGLRVNDPKVQVVRDHVNYDVLEDPDPKREGALVVRVGENLLTPEEVSAQVLLRIKQDAEARLKQTVTHAVITVPAYFAEPQRVATRKAGNLAGLQVKAILDEPTAAALAEYGDAGVRRGRILVFDFGGGTLDISVVQVMGNDFRVTAYTGDNFLGGDDIVQGLTRLIRAWIEEQGGHDDPNDQRLTAVLQEEAERAKKILAGGSPTYDVIIPRACARRDGSILDVEMSLTEQDLATVLVPFETRVRRKIEDLLNKDSLQPDYFSEVLMVGGTSAIPQFQRLMRQIFEADGEKRVRLASSPMEAVAKGAALYGGRLKGLRCVACGHENALDAKDCADCAQPLHSAAFSFEAGAEVRMTLPRSLGVRYAQGEDPDCYQVILHKGAPYPTTQRELFRIPSTNRFAIDIYEGDDPRASRNQQISTLRVDQIPSDVTEGAPVAVGFTYDRERTLFITLEYPTSRSHHRPTWRLDKPKEPPADDPLQGLMNVIPQVKGFLAEYRSFMEPGVKVKLQEDLQHAETAITTGDRDEAVRLHGVMAASLFHGSGIASALFLAERTTLGDDPRLGPAIHQAAERLRQQCQTKDSGREATRKALEELVNQVFMSKVGTQDVDALREWETIKR